MVRMGAPATCNCIASGPAIVLARALFHARDPAMRINERDSGFVTNWSAPSIRRIARTASLGPQVKNAEGSHPLDGGGSEVDGL